MSKAALYTSGVGGPCVGHKWSVHEARGFYHAAREVDLQVELEPRLSTVSVYAVVERSKGFRIRATVIHVFFRLHPEFKADRARY